MSTEITMYHPEKWGEGYYIGPECVPFRLIDGEFIEQAPINIPRNFESRRFALAGGTVETYSVTGVIILWRLK